MSSAVVRSGNAGRSVDLAWLGIPVGRALVPVAILALWWLAAANSDLIPGVLETLRRLVSAAFQDGWAIAPAVDSLKAVLGGSLIATVLGVTVGVILGRSRVLGDALGPFITAMFATPRIIIYPVMLAIFGAGLEAKLWLAVVSAVFPIIMNTMAGLRNIKPSLIRLGQSLDCSNWQMFSKIYFPAAAPSIMVGVRIGFSVSFVTVTVAEMYASSSGLGLLLQNNYAFQRYDDLFAIVLLITLFAIIGNFVLWLMERQVHRTMS